MRLKKIEEEERKERERRNKPPANKRKADQISQPPRADNMATAFADDYVESVEEINKKIAIETEQKKKEVKKANKKMAGFL